MAAARLVLPIEQGAQFTLALTLSNKPPASGPLDLTGCQTRAQMRAHHGADAGLLYELTTGNGRLAITDALGGQITLAIPCEDSSDWVVGCR